MGILWIASYPRSGNTLARMALWRTYGVESRSLYSDGALDKEGLQGLGLLFDQERPRFLVRRLRKEEQIYPVKTHVCLDNVKGTLPLPIEPAIYVHRDGRDALLSHAYFIQAHHSKGKEIQDILYQLVHGARKSARPWSASVLSWANRPRTSYVSYKELVADPIGSIRRCVAELDLDWEEQEQGTMPTFEQLHEAAPDFFRRGIHGQGEKEMPASLHKAFWARHRRGMEHYGYSH